MQKTKARHITILATYLGLALFFSCVRLLIEYFNMKFFKGYKLTVAIKDSRIETRNFYVKKEGEACILICLQDVVDCRWA